MKGLRVGIVGLGYQGRIHLCNCLRIRDVEVVAVADSSKLALSSVSQLGLKCYDDHEEMIRKERLDVVVVALPTHLHKDCSISAAEAGIHIFVEKPLARTTEEARQIGHAVAKNDVRLMVGMCQRFAARCQRLKRDIEAGTLGRIDFASGLFFTGPFVGGGRVAEWVFDPSKIGGAMFDTGCHLVDLFLWYFGDVRSCVGRRESLFNLGYDDYGEVFMRFKSGVNALAIVSWRTRKPCYRIEVVGEYGRRVAVSEYFGIFDVGLARAGLSFAKENMLRRLRGGPFLPLGEEYYKELDYFLKCIVRGDAPRPDVSDWLRVSDVMDIVYKEGIVESS